MPKLGEGLKDYYDRTLEYWTLTAHALLESTGKTMRRDGFVLAAQHFSEVPSPPPRARAPLALGSVLLCLFAPPVMLFF